MEKQDLRNSIHNKELDISDYEQKCQKILDFEEIRFSGLLDEFGIVLAGGFKLGILSPLTDDEHQSICTELASRVSKRRKFNSKLGHVKYSASRRENAVIMSFPINDHVVMIIADSHINIDRFAFRILSILGRQWGENDEK